MILSMFTVAKAILSVAYTRFCKSWT